MILLGTGWPGRTSLGLFLPSPPLRHVSPFTSVGGGRGSCGAFCPPVVLQSPQDSWGLPVQAERVDTCIQTPVSISRTGGASSPLQEHSLHLPCRPNSLWESGLCECRPPKCVLHTPLRWYERQKWHLSYVRGILNPFAFALSIAIFILNPGLICI